MGEKDSTTKQPHSEESESTPLDSKMNRRTFLKASTISAGVIGLGGIALSTGNSTTVVQNPTENLPATSNSDPFASQTVTLNINGKSYEVSVEPRDMLNNVLRDDLGLIGTKRPCNRGECGGCTVLIDGVAYMSCTYPAYRAAGHSITTVEGYNVPSSTESQILNALQLAWVQEDGGQCSGCQPGQIMSATALLLSNPNPTLDEIKAGMSGNLCRCGNYDGIIASIQLAAQNLQGGSA
ncbi:MAG: (2Fe-2S)-binding protein [Nitrososphaerota archaeon]|jgi:aerobic-type carbon monoxide dehydrogenase small subunit (CoxS/CutS family)|nr:(2Fe-2S)-binding protein [Nitrososphaerota archaeon]